MHVCNIYAVDQVVITMRDDISIESAKSRDPFQLVGVFIIRDGKIDSWID